MLAIDPAQRPEMVDIATRLTDVRAEPPENDVTRAIPRPQGPPPPVPLPQDLAQDLPQHPPHELPQELSPRTMALESQPPAGPPPALPPLLPMQAEPAPRATRSLWPVLVAAVLVITLGVVLGIVLLSGNDTNASNAGNGTPVPPVTHPSSSTHSSQRNHSSQPPTSSATSPGPTHSSTSAGPPSASELAGAVTDYYDLVPANLSAGWDRLSRHFQTTKAQDRQNYDSYWNTVQRVDVLSSSGQPPMSAIATLKYHYKNGHIVVERTRFDFVRQSGVLKIDRTQVIG
jgi:hypothetical protein